MRLTQRALLIVLLMILMGVLGARPSSATEDASDAQILQVADQARFLSADAFNLTTDIVAERPDGMKQATVRALFKRFPDDNGNGFRVHIEFLQPPEMQGDVYLIVQNKDICRGDRSCSFFWGPNLIPGQPLRVSAGQTTLFGDSSVAETAGIPYAGYYSVKEKHEEMLNERPVLALSLLATDPSVAFQQVTLWVDPSNFQPIQSELFAVSGEPLDRVIYEEYAKLGDDQYLLRQRIENLLQKGSVTEFTVTDVQITSLSDDLFDPNQLGQR